MLGVDAAAMAFRTSLIQAGFAAFAATGLHRAFPSATRGVGAILTFHHVRRFAPKLPGYAPNRLLEITPEFLDAALRVVKGEGIELVSLDEALARLGDPGAGRFVALTFDDAYRDLLAQALPTLEKHNAPFTCFVATGFAERTARLWWLELEDALLGLDRLRLDRPGLRFDLSLRDPQDKSRAFHRLYWALRALPEARMLEEIAALGAQAGVDPTAYARDLCMDWDEVKRLAANPLAEIGAHGVSHKMLAQWPAALAEEEIAASKAALEARLGKPVRHFAYPVGDRSSAGAREFAMARALGFAGAVTTRPGMLFADHAAHRHALPRISINGLWQSEAALKTLLSGAPFALWNRGRRLNVA